METTQTSRDAVPFPNSGPFPPRETVAQQPSDAPESDIGRPYTRSVQAQSVVGDTSLPADCQDYDIYRPGVKRLVVKIVNIKVKGLEDRNYALVDKRTDVFSEKFGFEVYDPLGKDRDVIMNATKEEFDTILKTTKERVMKENIGCLVFVVSSHGTEKIVPQNGRVPEHREHCIVCSDGELIMTRTMIDAFHTDYIRKTIPKLFVIQACRSAPEGVDVNLLIDAGITFYIKEGSSDDEEETHVPDTSQPSKKDVDEAQKQQDAFLPAIPPCAPDTVVIFGSAAGKYAYLDKTRGSWILHSLNTEVESMKEKKITLFDLLNKVNCSQAAKHSKLGVKGPDQKGIIAKPVTSAGSFTHQLTKSLTLEIHEEEEEEEPMETP